MCGVVGVIGKKEASSLVIEGLKKLEYRGYDSAGIASFNQESIQVVKSEGKWLIIDISFKKYMYFFLVFHLRLT